jgi:hypothetical protein
LEARDVAALFFRLGRLLDSVSVAGASGSSGGNEGGCNGYQSQP